MTTGTHYGHRTIRLNDWIDLWHISYAFSSPFFLVTLKINFNNRLKITIKSQDTRCIHSITSQFHQWKIRDFFPLEHFMNSTTQHSSRQQSVVASLNSEKQKKRKIRAAHQSMVDHWLERAVSSQRLQLSIGFHWKWFLFLLLIYCIVSIIWWCSIYAG